jgi:hypothetical protein
LLPVIKNDHILRYLDLFIFITLIDPPTLLLKKPCHSSMLSLLHVSLCLVFLFLISVTKIRFVSLRQRDIG